MQISIRTPLGWQKKRNRDTKTCDACGAPLFIAPHGGVYCEESHEISDLVESGTRTPKQ